MSNQSLGQQGEDKAAEYLQKNGYKIIERNFTRRPWGEIDIVAQKNGMFGIIQGRIIFVEVKSIVKRKDFFPEDQITPKKEKQLRKMARIYLSANKLPQDTPCQIDIIAIEFNKNGQIIALRHLQNALEDNY